MKHKNRNPKFNEGAKFPIAEGSTWDIFLQNGEQSIRKAQHQVDRALRTAERAFQEEANTCTRSKDMMLQIAAHRDHPSGQKSWMERQHDITHQMERQVYEWYQENWRDRVAAATGTRPSPYAESNGIPIAPKTTSELYKRTDPAYIKMWDTALRKEWDGLCEREVFEHDLTKQQLYDRGILPGKRLIGIRVIYETKVKNGEFERCKCRAVAQGFGFKKGRDFDSCFAAAPSLQSNRLISALCAILGWRRVTFDINQAYLLGNATADAQYPMRYPEGRIRDQHRLPNGDERYLLCLGNIYGLPTSGRTYAIERDRILMEVNPRAPPEGAGWTCKKLEYETCMFEIKAKHCHHSASGAAGLSPATSQRSQDLAELRFWQGRVRCLSVWSTNPCIIQQLLSCFCWRSSTGQQRSSTGPASISSSSQRPRRRLT
jgi:hypothetical protein